MIDCAEVTAAAVAEKETVVALAGTLTEEGTVRTALLLPRPMLNPPEGAAELMVAVQESVPTPVTVAAVQVSALTAVLLVPESPWPCSLTLAVGTVVELLVMLRVPESLAAAVGP